MFSRCLFKLWTMKSKWSKERSEAGNGPIGGRRKVSVLNAQGYQRTARRGVVEQEMWKGGDCG